MKTAYLTAKDFLYIVPVSLALGALFASIKMSGSCFLSFSFLFLLSIVLLKMAHNWSKSGKTLGYIIALSFFLRLPLESHCTWLCLFMDHQR